MNNNIISFTKFEDEADAETAERGEKSTDQNQSGISDNSKPSLPIENYPNHQSVSIKPDVIEKENENDNKAQDLEDKKTVQVTENENQKNNQSSHNYPQSSFHLLTNSISTITTFLGIGILNITQMIIMKQKNNVQDIAAFGLGITWINACSFAFIIALNDGIRSISSQLYGAKKLKILGIVYNQSIAITWVIFLLSLSLLLNTTNLLIFLGIEPEIAHKSQQFTIYAIPSLIANVYFETSRQFLFSQKIFHVHMYSQSLAALLHGIWCYIFVIEWDMGIKGAGIARSITFILSYSFVWIQMQWKSYGKEALVEFELKTSFHIKGWLELLKVAIPAGGTNYLKWCSIECLTILVGNLPDKSSLAGHAAFFSMNIFFSMFAKGLQTTVNSYIGIAIGEGKGDVAKNLTIMSLKATLILCAILFCISLAIENYCAEILASGPNMTQHFLTAYRMYMRYDIWGNFLQQVLAGILAGMNRQNDTVKYYMFTFLIQQFVVAYYLGFYMDLGLLGIWIGRVSAGVTNSICFLLILYGLDIQEEIHSVKLRIEKTKQFHQKTLQALEKEQGDFSK